MFCKEKNLLIQSISNQNQSIIMPKFHLRRTGAAIAGSGITALLLTSCSTIDPLLSHLKTFESDIAGEPAAATASFDEVYGPEWTEYAIVCPYSPQKNVHEALATEDSPPFRSRACKILRTTSTSNPETALAMAMAMAKGSGFGSQAQNLIFAIYRIQVHNL